MRILCPFCFGERYDDSHTAEGWYKCMDCGEFFNDDDVEEYHDAVDRGEL